MILYPTPSPEPPQFEMVVFIITADFDTFPLNNLLTCGASQGIINITRMRYNEHVNYIIVLASVKNTVICNERKETVITSSLPLLSIKTTSNG